LDEKFNLYILSFKKKWHRYWEVANKKEQWSDYARSLFPFFQSYKKYNDGISSKDYEILFNYEKYKNSDLKQELERMVKLTRRVVHQLLEKEREWPLKQRNLQISLRVNKRELLPVLDLLSTEGKISWDKEKQEICLTQN